MDLSKTQIDALGDRLRREEPELPDDLNAYISYATEFADALEEVDKAVADSGLEIATSRFKSLASTVAKLRRQSIRLTQIEDIAGCRVVVDALTEQDEAVGAISTAFPAHRVRDFRDNPRFGYRAVHVIVTTGNGRAVEVQLRTRAQNIWANVSEGAAEHWGIEVKYGGGPSEIRAVLDNASRGVQSYDLQVVSMSEDLRRIETLQRGIDDGSIELDQEELDQVKSAYASTQAAMDRALKTLDSMADLLHSTEPDSQ